LPRPRRVWVGTRLRRCCADGAVSTTSTWYMARVTFIFDCRAFPEGRGLGGSQSTSRHVFGPATATFCAKEETIDMHSSLTKNNNTKWPSGQWVSYVRGAEKALRAVRKRARAHKTTSLQPWHMHLGRKVHTDLAHLPSAKPMPRSAAGGTTRLTFGASHGSRRRWSRTRRGVATRAPWSPILKAYAIPSDAHLLAVHPTHSHYQTLWLRAVTCPVGSDPARIVCSVRQST
jgi:hypothetical protein